MSNPKKATSSSKKDQNPNLFGLAQTVFDGLSEINVPETATLKEYHNLYSTLCDHDSAFRLFSKCGGETGWLKGAILNILRPIDKTKKNEGIAKKGEWAQFCKTLDISTDTTELLRHINDRFSRSESRMLGYSEMVGIYRAERAMENNPANATTKGKDKGKGKGTGNNPKSLKVKEAEKKFKRIVDSLEFMKTAIPTMVDLKKDPCTNKSTLTNLLTEIDTIANLMPKLRESIATAHMVIDKFVTDGQIIAMKGAA